MFSKMHENDYCARLGMALDSCANAVFWRRIDHPGAETHILPGIFGAMPENYFLVKQ